MVTSKMPSALLIASYTCALLLLTQIPLTILTGVRMTTAFVDFNGVVPEKFDAVRLSHLVDAEYGNQGIDFKMVPREGFGWMNGTSDLSFPRFQSGPHVPSLQPHTKSASPSLRTTCVVLSRRAPRQRSSSVVS